MRRLTQAQISGYDRVNSRQMARLATGGAELSVPGRSIRFAGVPPRPGAELHPPAALLVSPVAFRRWMFRRNEAERLPRHANVHAIHGLAVVALAVCAAVSMVLHVVGLNGPTGLLAGATPGCFAFLWRVLPIADRLGTNREPFGPKSGRTENQNERAVPHRKVRREEVSREDDPTDEATARSSAHGA